MTFGVEQAYRFATDLRLNPERTQPDGWRVDWTNAPWPVKVYDGGDRSTPPEPLSGLLWDSLAVTTVRWTPGSAGLRPRRPIASGGAMYPTEAYVALPAADPPVLCHYDPARHELTDLRQPHPAAAVRAALGLAPDAGVPTVVLVLANRFWKNVHKYGNFAYRLGAVDVGVALGRLVVLAADRLPDVRVTFDFPDADVATAFGLAVDEEPPYVLITAGPTVAAPPGAGITASRPPAVRERSRRVRRLTLLDAMHVAACQGRTTNVDVAAPPDAVGAPVPLPPARPVARPTSRASDGRRFAGRPVPVEALADVLADAWRGHLRLTRRCAPDPPPIQLYCVAQRVTGLPTGCYRFLAGRRALAPVGIGQDPNASVLLQSAQRDTSFNIELAAFTVHVAATVRHGDARGFRVQQMIVGAAVDTITVRCAELGLSAHPLLGYRAGDVDVRYGLGEHWATFAQVCVGSVRPGFAMEATVVG